MPADASDTRHLTAVVPAQARPGTLQEVLDALDGQTRPPERVLLVDSDATPEVRDVLDAAARRDDVDVLTLGYSGGSAGSFGAGINAAAEAPGADLIVVFDDDAVPARDCIERLLGALEAHPEAGAVGPASCTPEGDLAWGLHVGDAAGRFHRVTDRAELQRAAAGGDAVPVAELAWHGLVIPVAVIERVGGLWIDLFMWYEDVEFGLRLRGAGLPVYVVPDAIVTHPPPPRTIRRSVFGVRLDVPVTDRHRAYLMVRNTLVVRHRHCGWQFWWADLPLTMVRAVVVTVLLPGSRLKAVRDVLLRSVVDAARGRLGPPRFS